MVKADSQIELVALLQSLRRQHNESAERFGVRLAAITGGKPYSPTYISLMEAGKKRISGFVASALHTLAGRQVMVCPAAGVALTPGCIIQRAERTCKRPGCDVRFIPDGKAEYCSPACRKAKQSNKE